MNSSRDRWKRLGRGVVRGAVWLRDHEPLTGLGWLVASGCAVALAYFGYGRLDLLLFIVGGVGLGITLVAALMVTVASIALWTMNRRRRTEQPLRLECGIASSTGFSLPTLWYVPLVKIEWKCREPEATVRVTRRRRRYHEQLLPLRRGLMESLERRVEISDAFGLARIAIRLREERRVRFTPSIGALKNVQVARSIAGGEDLPHPAGPADGDRADLRRYVPGDPVRFILWKVFAKNRQIVVRTPERALSPTRQTIAFLATGEGDEPAAGAVRMAIESGSLGSDWRLGCDGSDMDVTDLPRALELLARSAHVASSQGGAGLDAFLSRNRLGRAGRAIVFVPACAGPWLERVASVAAMRKGTNPSQSALEFVVCADGIERATRFSWLRRVALLANGRTAEDPRVQVARSDEIMRIVRVLESARARVTILDRRSGRAFTEAHRRALEAA